jgi:hypothetical protein
VRESIGHKDYGEKKGSRTFEKMHVTQDDVIRKARGKISKAQNEIQTALAKQVKLFII